MKDGYRKILTVSQLNQELRINLATFFSNLWIEGEITNLAAPPSGHIYFSLKDSSSQVKAVMFRRAAAYLPFALRNGLQVLVKGSLDVYPPRGDHQIIADLVEPKGVGSLRLAFEELCERLRREGLFDERHKKAIPAYPEKIGLVTSRSGAVVHDLIKVIHRRFPCCDIQLFPVAVQGSEAVLEIPAALNSIDRLAAPPDLLILARGGGSMEDLSPFNSEAVARAVFEVSLPIISAVGHESDFTISDLVADLRAPTPSAAGELAVKDKQEILRRLGDKLTRLVTGQQERLAYEKLKQATLKKRLSRVTPQRVINDWRQKIGGLQLDLRKNIFLTVNAEKQKIFYLGRDLRRVLSELTIPRSRHRLELIASELVSSQQKILNAKGRVLSAKAERLDALSPLNTLTRGYSLIRDGSGNLVRRADRVKIDERLEIILSQGKLDCQVTRIYEKNGLPEAKMKMKGETK